MTRTAAAKDPRIARKMVAQSNCDFCGTPALTFMIDGHAAEFVCRDHYLTRATERKEEAAARRRKWAA